MNIGQMGEPQVRRDAEVDVPPGVKEPALLRGLAAPLVAVLAGDRLLRVVAALLIRSIRALRIHKPSILDPKLQ